MPRPYKRHASEALEELTGVDSPASKRSRIGDSVDRDDESPEPNGHEAEERTPRAREAMNGQRSSVQNGKNSTVSGREGHRRSEEEDVDDDDDEEDEDDDEEEDEIQPRAPIRQSAPTAGYEDLYLHTIDRSLLDFDFEKLCSISLSNINVYACLVCGRYFQGRGPKSHAYFHALDEDHHVFINMETRRVYVLPEGYEVTSKSLDDIKYVSDPRYTRQEVVRLDRNTAPSRTLSGKEYMPGFVGMNNIKENDYLNVVVQALSHVGPLRNYLLLEDVGSRSELVKRCSVLFRKIWNPRAFKAHVSPHELLQEISLRSSKRFTLTTQSDPVDFLSWFLNNMHLGLGGSKTKPGSSPIQQIFQGRMKVESQAVVARANVTEASTTGMGSGDGRQVIFEEAAEIKVDIVRFLLLTLDLPPAPLFQDDLEGNIIPQVPLSNILSKYDGVRAQEHLAQRKRYRLLHPLPPFLMFHVKRFSQNKFVAERNPTIVTFDARNLDISPYVEPNPAEWPPGEPIWYDLVANVVHEAVRAKDDVADSGEERKTWKVQLKDKGRDEWVVCQDLFVDKVQSELLYLGETYLQIWERRRDPKGKGKGKA